MNDIHRSNGEAEDGNDNEEEEEDHERFVRHRWLEFDVNDTRIYSYT